MLINSVNLTVARVHYVNGRQKYFDVETEDCNIVLGLSKRDILELASSGHKFTNVTISDKGVVRVDPYTTRIDDSYFRRLQKDRRKLQSEIGIR